MQGLLRATSVIVRVALCVCLGGVWAMAEEPPAEIAIENRPAVDVMYKVHVGPYWRAGQVFAEAGVIVADNAVAGPVYCRYLDDPASVLPSRLRTEIGFFVTGVLEVPEGFTRGTSPATRCATLVASGSYGTTHGHHRRLFDWIASEDLEPAGEIMEIYPQPDGVATWVTVCVPVRPLDSAPAKTLPLPPGRPFGALLQEKEYSGAAVALFRDVDSLTPARRRWLSGVVDRLKVIRAIVAGRYGAEADDTIAMIAGIVERASDALNGGGAKGSEGVPIVPDYDARTASDIHRDLDRCMVRAHLKSAPAGEIYDDLAALLLDTGRLVCKDAVDTDEERSPADRR